MSQAGLVEVNTSGPVAPTQYEADVGTAAALADILNINGVAAQGVSTSAAGNTLDITVANATTISKGVASFDAAGFTVAAGVVSLLAPGGGGITWTRVAGNSQALVKQNGYIPTNGALTTFTLPALAAIGDTFYIAGEGAGLWLVAQNAGQQIHVGVLSSTSGVVGNVFATHRRDCIEITCTVANTEFIVVDAFGNLGVT